MWHITEVTVCEKNSTGFVTVLQNVKFNRLKVVQLGQRGSLFEMWAECQLSVVDDANDSDEKTGEGVSKQNGSLLTVPVMLFA